MKKIRKICAVLLAFAAVMSFGGCFGGNGGGEEPKIPTAEKVQVSIYKDGTPTPYEFTVGEVASIPVPAAPDLYFAGVYTAPEGGTRYFDETGKSTMVWQKDSPTELYVRFESIYNLNFSETDCLEDPLSWTGYGNAAFVYTPDTAFRNAIKGNLDKKLVVNYSFLYKDSSGNSRIKTTYFFRNSDNSSGEVYNRTELEGTDSYVTYCGSFTLRAGDLLNGDLHFYIEKSYGYEKVYHVKNVQVSFAFEKP